jgi:hypothetical protein
MTFDEADSAFLYDPATGVVSWRETRGGKLAGSPAGNATKRHVWIKYKGRYVAAHQIAWLLHYGKPAGSRIDHANGNGLDNRITNLRRASQAENCQNRRIRSDNQTGLKGVQLRPNGKWRARIFLDGRSVNLGHFATAKEAHDAYTLEAKAQFGKFARPL